MCAAPERCVWNTNPLSLRDEGACIGEGPDCKTENHSGNVRCSPDELSSSVAYRAEWVSIMTI